MSDSRNPRSWFDPASTDAPQVSGERLVSMARLGISILAVPVFIAYFGTTDVRVWVPLAMSITAISVWATMSVAYLFVISKGLYRPWLSFVSAAVDVAFVTLVQMSLDYVLPLNFVNGPITAMYFVMIGLAALRKSRRLVLLVGVCSAVVHLVVSVSGFAQMQPPWLLSLSIGATPVDVSILDEVVVSVCLALVGWIVGHVTRELCVSERHYHDLFEHVPDGILIAGEDGTVITVNSRFVEMVGGPLDAPLAGRKVEEFLTVDQVLGSPTVLMRADGTTAPVRTVAMPVDFKGARASAMSVRNVEEQVHLERRLAQSQKMETIGRLAGGLAHDFNNILAGIIGAASLAERMVGRLEGGPTRDKLAQQFQVVQECGESARIVVKRLLTFSRTAVIETHPIDLRALAEDVASICRNTFPSDVEIEVTGAPSPLVVRGDSTSLTQAMLNLCINARDAMPKSGRLSIRVREISAQEMSAERHPSVDPNEDYCCIEVDDTGAGIDDSVIEKIFDPFFTTKPPGEGTGLGLPMVYNIARQHGGFVDVKSRVGVGTCFRMFLTRARESLLPAEPEELRLPRGKGRVFVVDDDDILRCTLENMLTELGYEVACAADGASALSMLGAKDSRFDLVLLDVVMPEMDGVRTLELMRRQGLTVPVVLTSGFMNGVSMRSVEKHSVAGYLRKPFTFMSLAQTVQTALGGGSRGD